METQQKWWNFPICPLLVTLPHAEATSQLNIHTGYISIHYVCYIMTELELYGWPCSIRRHQERFWTRVPTVLKKEKPKKVTRLYPECCCNRVKKRKQEIEREIRRLRRGKVKSDTRTAAAVPYEPDFDLYSNSWTHLDLGNLFPFVGNKSRVSYRARVLYINIHRSQQPQENQRRDE